MQADKVTGRERRSPISAISAITRLASCIQLYIIIICTSVALCHVYSGNGSEGFDRPPSDVYSSFSGFVFEEGGYFEGGYEGGSFGDDWAGA